LRLDNLRLDGALRWKAEDRQLGRSRRVMWKARTSEVVAPACVGTHKQVLNVPTACRRYGHGKPSSRLSMKACLFSTTSLGVMGEKFESASSPPCGFWRIDDRQLEL
jgi:hypothetical protein